MPPGKEENNLIGPRGARPEVAMKGIYECRIIGQDEVRPGVVRTLIEGPEIANESHAGQFVNVRVASTNRSLVAEAVLGPCGLPR